MMAHSTIRFSEADVPRVPLPARFNTEKLLGQKPDAHRQVYCLLMVVRFT